MLELLLPPFFLVPAAEQYHLKSCTESLVAQGVAHGVDSAVDVAQPVPDCPQGLRDATFTEGIDQHHNVVWCPCDDESKEDGTECLSCLLLLH